MFSRTRVFLLKRAVDKAVVELLANSAFVHSSTAHRKAPTTNKWFAAEAATQPATLEVEQWPTVKHEIPNINSNVSKEYWITITYNNYSINHLLFTLRMSIVYIIIF